MVGWIIAGLVVFGTAIGVAPIIHLALASAVALVVCLNAHVGTRNLLTCTDFDRIFSTLFVKRA